MSAAPRLLVVSLLVVAAASGPAQTPPIPQDPPPGMVLVDDMYLPWDSVSGDSVYAAAPWPGGIVPYFFDGSVSAYEQTRMLEAFSEIEAVSQVRFVPYQAGGAYSLIIRDNALSMNVSNSAVGFQGHHRRDDRARR